MPMISLNSMLFFILQTLMVRLVVSYTQIFEQNYGTLSSSCSTSSSFYWQNTLGTTITNCDNTSCAFSSPSSVMSMLSISDSYYTFNFSISPSLLYSKIGVDITFISSLPNVKLTLLSDATITTSTTADVPDVYEVGSVSCTSIASATTLINARATSNSNIGSTVGSLKIEKIASTQILGIRSIRVWVNCSDNCSICGSSTLCNVCLSGFNRYASSASGTLHAACEVNENCPSNCQKCYTLNGTQTCSKCDAGFTLSSTTNQCDAITPPAYGCSNSYPKSSTQCMGYSTKAYYLPRSGTGVWTQLSTFDAAKYKCENEKTVLIYDYYGYKLFRCGCVVSNCSDCSQSTDCLACNSGYYRDGYWQLCMKCSTTHCSSSCPSTGVGCSTCDASYSANPRAQCGICNDPYCASCDTTVSPNVCNSCVPGYTKNGAGVCESNACPTDEEIDITTGSCACLSGFTRDSSGYCGGTPGIGVAVTCQANATYSSAANQCVCDSGYTMDASNVCQVTIVVPVCGSNETYNNLTSACECDSGYTRNGSGVCTLTSSTPTCSGSNETYNNTTSACECNSGYTRNGSGVCTTTSSTPSCSGSNETYNNLTSACECDSGYTRNGSGVCTLTSSTPSCSGSNQVWNTSTSVCDCATGYTWNAGNTACVSSSGSGGVATTSVSIRQKLDSNVYSIVLDCSQGLTKYAGQDIENALDLVIASGVTEFTYTIVKIEGSSVTIMLYPQVTLRGETALVTFTDSVFISENNLSSSPNSVGLSDFIFVSESQKSANDAAGYAGQVASVAIISTLLPIAILSNFYVIINTIDLTGFLYYLLFVDVRYPSNVLAFYDFFKNFQFPFIPNIFEYIIDAEYTQEAAKPFTTNQTQLYFLSNSGQSVSIVIFILAIYAVGKALSYASIPKVQNYLKRAMYETWEVSAFFDLLWTLYIYLIIGSLLQFECYDNGEGNYILNYVIHSVFAVICIVSPFGISVLLHKNKNMKSDAYFKMKFASLIGGIQLYDEESVEDTRMDWKMKLSKMYMGILYVRKLIFAAIIVLLTEYTYLQLCLISVLNVILIAYILYIEPLEVKSENIKNAIGEGILIAVQICVFFLVEDSVDSDEDKRYLIGWFIIGFSGFIISWHTIQLLIESVVSLASSIKQKCSSSQNNSTKVHAFNQQADNSANNNNNNLNNGSAEEQLELKQQERQAIDPNESQGNVSLPQQQTQIASMIASTQRFSMKDDSPRKGGESPAKRTRLSIVPKRNFSIVDFNKVDSNASSNQLVNKRTNK